MSSMSSPSPPLLAGKEAADFLRLSVRTLERLRVSGGGPIYVKCGRLVRYRQSDLDRWLSSRERHSTSEEA
jgi:excisionase family DNA binding protein